MNSKLKESSPYFTLEASEYKGEEQFRLDMPMGTVIDTFGSFDEDTLNDFLQAETDQDYLALARRFPVMFFFHHESDEMTDIEDIKDVCNVLRFVFASKAVIDDYEKGETIAFPDFLYSLGFVFEETDSEFAPIYRINIDIKSQGYKSFLGDGYITNDAVSFVILECDSLDSAMTDLKRRIAHLTEGHLRDFRLGVSDQDLGFYLSIHHVISGLYYYAVEQWNNKRIGLCSVCGKPYLAPASRKNPRRYCSNKCRKAAYNKSHSESDNDSGAN